MYTYIHIYIYTHMGGTADPAEMRTEVATSFVFTAGSPGLGFRGHGLGFRASGLAFRVESFGF